MTLLQNICKNICLTCMPHETDTNNKYEKYVCTVVELDFTAMFLALDRVLHEKTLNRPRFIRGRNKYLFQVDRECYCIEISLRHCNHTRYTNNILKFNL
jgi:hypothetical protein